MVLGLEACVTMQGFYMHIFYPENFILLFSLGKSKSKDYRSSCVISITA